MESRKDPWKYCDAFNPESLKRSNENEAIITIEERNGDVTGRGPGRIEIAKKGDFLHFTPGDNNNSRIPWIKQKKCCDAILISTEDNNTHIHIFELKTKLTFKDWEKICDQLEGGALSSLAVCGVLDIFQPYKIYIYIAYHEIEEESFKKRLLIETGRKMTVGTKPSPAIMWKHRQFVFREKRFNIVFIKRDCHGNAQHNISNLDNLNNKTHHTVSCDD